MDESADDQQLQQESERAFNEGEYGVAEGLLRRLLPVQEEKLGIEHPNTLRTLWHLAAALEAQGQDDEADALTLRSSSSQLLRAINDGRVESALALLDEGANPNARDPRDRTALMYAGLSGQTRILNRLLEL